MMEKVKIPDFLKTPELTKPDDNEKHYEKLIEIANGFDEKDATYICRIFARKFPNVMLLTLSSEINSLTLLRDEVLKSYNTYERLGRE